MWEEYYHDAQKLLNQGQPHLSFTFESSLYESQLQVAFNDKLCHIPLKFCCLIEKNDHIRPCPEIYGNYAKIIVSQLWMGIHKIRG